MCVCIYIYIYIYRFKRKEGTPQELGPGKIIQIPPESSPLISRVSVRRLAALRLYQFVHSQWSTLPEDPAARTASCSKFNMVCICDFTCAAKNTYKQ